MPGIYLDYAATAPLRPEVRRSMRPFLGDSFGNPSSVHAMGNAAHDAVEQARASVAALFSVPARGITFTSGGTESINLALLGVAFQRRSVGHLVTSRVEHAATLRTARFLEERLGWSVTYLPVDGTCSIDPDDVRRSLTPSTVIVSLVHANSEVGTVQRIGEIGRVVREAGVLFHVDAVQSAGKLPLDPGAWGVDLLSVSAHKIGGPKGVGALYAREGVNLDPVIQGGGQEDGLRSGTENVPGIVGFGAAVEAVLRHGKDEGARTAELRDRLSDGVRYSTQGAHLMGHPTDRLPGFAHLCLEGLDGHWLVKELSRAGIYAATGSACSSGKSEPSHVLSAMGIAPDLAMGALRLTLGWATTADEIREAIVVVPQAVERLRERARNGVDLATEYARDCRAARRQAIGRAIGGAISKMLSGKS